MMENTMMSALSELPIGPTWYQRVYSHSHAWPGYCPVSFIIPHWSPDRCWALPRLAK